MDESVASVPASAVLIGEYTHYTSGTGHAVAASLPVATTVNLSAVQGSPGDVTIAGTDYLSGNDGGHWTDLVLGCLRAAAVETPLPALRIEVKSQIPAGWGGAASLCVAVLRAVNRLTDAGWFDDEIACLAHRAACEQVARGKVDPYTCAHGRPGQATLLNTKSLRSRNCRLDYRMPLVVVDPGLRQNSVDDRRETRLQRLVECTEARDRLGVGSLCELGCRDLPRLSSLPANIAKRAWHVITENMRALELVRALEQGDLERQADLLATSHASQRDDFEFCWPEADALVQSSIRFGVQGAKQVGDDGPVVALVPHGLVSDWWAQVSKENPKCQLISTDVLASQEKPVPPRWAIRQSSRKGAPKGRGLLMPSGPIALSTAHLISPRGSPATLS